MPRTLKYVFLFVCFGLLLAANASANSFYNGRTGKNGYFSLIGNNLTTATLSDLTIQFDALWPSTAPYGDSRELYFSILNSNATGAAYHGGTLPVALVRNGIATSLIFNSTQGYVAAATQYSNVNDSTTTLFTSSALTTPVLNDQQFHRFKFQVAGTTYSFSIDGTTIGTGAIDAAHKPTGHYFFLMFRSISTTLAPANNIRFCNLTINGVNDDLSATAYTSGVAIDSTNSPWLQNMAASPNNWLIETTTPVELSHFEAE